MPERFHRAHRRSRHINVARSPVRHHAGPWPGMVSTIASTDEPTNNAPVGPSPDGRSLRGVQRGAPLRGNPSPRRPKCTTSLPPGSVATPIRSAAGSRSTTRRCIGTSRPSSPARRTTAVQIATSMSPPSTPWRGCAGRDGSPFSRSSRFRATAAVTATPSTWCACAGMYVTKPTADKARIGL